MIVKTILNSLLTNGFSHPYQLDESTFILGASRVFFLTVNSICDENHVSKQNSPRLDAASGAILFAYAPGIYRLRAFIYSVSKATECGTSFQYKVASNLDQL